MEIVEKVKQELRAPYESVCRELEVPYSSLMRWKSRRMAGEAVVSTPGPCKIEALESADLHADILQLNHGRKRTHGTGALYEKYRDQISRRNLQALVEAARRELRREEEALLRRIEWRVPGLVWSMDDTKKHWLENQRFGHMHVVMDLGSRYALRAMGDDMLANGWQVALSLEDLFLRHGAPLFLKLDGGSNFKHHEVRHMLDQHWVIPLISPPYYPPYNGGIEREHQEILRRLAARIGDGTVNARELRLVCEVSGHEVNHQRRPILGGQTACSAFQPGRRAVGLFGRRERKEVFEEIKALAVDIVQELDEHTDVAAETAFRYAAETWMQLNHMINVTQNGKVLPPFYQIQSH
jgi:hypothetical protein